MLLSLLTIGIVILTMLKIGIGNIIDLERDKLLLYTLIYTTVVYNFLNIIYSTYKIYSLKEIDSEIIEKYKYKRKRSIVIVSVIIIAILLLIAFFMYALARAFRH